MSASDRPNRIWVTRTEPQALATAARLAAMGFGVVVTAPVLEVERIAEARIDLAGIDALVFTSGHAVTAFAALSAVRDLPVFTVGEATADLARQAGFAAVTSADGDVGALAALIARAAPRPTRVLHPAAREPAADLAALLGGLGVLANTIAVYETVETGAFVSGVDAILVHSPRAGRAVAARYAGRPEAARISAYAISEAAAAPLRGAGFRAVSVAPRPTEAALLALLKG